MKKENLEAGKDYEQVIAYKCKDCGMLFDDFNSSHNCGEAGKEAIEVAAEDWMEKDCYEHEKHQCKKAFVAGASWQAKQATPVKRDEQEMKRFFAEHLGLKPGEELNTTDAYAVEWVLKNLI